MKSQPRSSTAPKRTLRAHSRHRITLRALAEHVGLSRTTISMILNDVPEATRFPEETRQRVVESAERLGYRPNYFARALGKRRTCLIGVIAPDFGDGFEAAVLSGFQRHLLNTEYTSFVSTHLWSPPLLKRHVETLCDRGAEGLLLINSTPSESPGIPTVTMCTDRLPIWSTRVSIDNAFGVRKAIDHLASLGHREIAFIKGLKGAATQKNAGTQCSRHARLLGFVSNPALRFSWSDSNPLARVRPREGASPPRNYSVAAHPSPRWLPSMTSQHSVR
jgi:DNA-binding LacI/PurR family transcriptional regulator